MSSKKTAFKSYEVQARLLRAVIAAHPDLKLNYAEIARHYGKDTTVYSLQHRFKHLRTKAEVIRLGLEQGFDPTLLRDEDVPKNLIQLDRKKIDIAKYFGESTADGIQFQFRSIKKDAQNMKAAADIGLDPISAIQLGGGSAAASPMSTPKTPRAKAVSTKTPTPRKTPTSRTQNAKSPIKMEPGVLSSVHEDEEDNDEALGQLRAPDTPTPKANMLKKMKRDHRELEQADNSGDSDPSYAPYSSASAAVAAGNTPIRHGGSPLKKRINANAPGLENLANLPNIKREETSPSSSSSSPVKPIKHRTIPRPQVQMTALWREGEADDCV